MPKVTSPPLPGVELEHPPAVTMPTTPVHSACLLEVPLPSDIVGVGSRIAWSSMQEGLDVSVSQHFAGSSVHNAPVESGPARSGESASPYWRKQSYRRQYPSGRNSSTDCFLSSIHFLYSWIWGDIQLAQSKKRANFAYIDASSPVQQLGMVLAQSKKRANFAYIDASSPVQQLGMVLLICCFDVIGASTALGKPGLSSSGKKKRQVRVQTWGGGKRYYVFNLLWFVDSADCAVQGISGLSDSEADDDDRATMGAVLVREYYCCVLYFAHLMTL